MKPELATKQCKAVSCIQCLIKRKANTNKNTSIYENDEYELCGKKSSISILSLRLQSSNPGIRNSAPLYRGGERLFSDELAQAHILKAVKGSQPGVCPTTLLLLLRSIEYYLFSMISHGSFVFNHYSVMIIELLHTMP